MKPLNIVLFHFVVFARDLAAQSASIDSSGSGESMTVFQLPHLPKQTKPHSQPSSSSSLSVEQEEEMRERRDAAAEAVQLRLRKMWLEQFAKNPFNLLQTGRIFDGKNKPNSVRTRAITNNQHEDLGSAEPELLSKEALNETIKEARALNESQDIDHYDKADEISDSEVNNDNQADDDGKREIPVLEGYTPDGEKNLELITRDIPPPEPNRYSKDDIEPEIQQIATAAVYAHEETSNQQENSNGQEAEVVQTGSEIEKAANAYETVTGSSAVHVPQSQQKLPAVQPAPTQKPPSPLPAVKPLAAEHPSPISTSPSPLPVSAVQPSPTPKPPSPLDEVPPSSVAQPSPIQKPPSALIEQEYSEFPSPINVTPKYAAAQPTTEPKTTAAPPPTSGVYDSSSSSKPSPSSSVLSEQNTSRQKGATYNQQTSQSATGPAPLPAAIKNYESTESGQSRPALSKTSPTSSIQFIPGPAAPASWGPQAPKIGMSLETLMQHKNRESYLSETQRVPVQTSQNAGNQAAYSETTAITLPPANAQSYGGPLPDVMSAAYPVANPMWSQQKAAPLPPQQYVGQRNPAVSAPVPVPASQNAPVAPQPQQYQNSAAQPIPVGPPQNYQQQNQAGPQQGYQNQRQLPTAPVQPNYQSQPQITAPAPQQNFQNSVSLQNYQPQSYQNQQPQQTNQNFASQQQNYQIQAQPTGLQQQSYQSNAQTTAPQGYQNPVQVVVPQQNYQSQPQPTGPAPQQSYQGQTAQQTYQNQPQPTGPVAQSNYPPQTTVQHSYSISTQIGNAAPQSYPTPVQVAPSQQNYQNQPQPTGPSPQQSYQNSAQLPQQSYQNHPQSTGPAPEQTYQNSAQPSGQVPSYQNNIPQSTGSQSYPNQASTQQQNYQNPVSQSAQNYPTAVSNQQQQNYQSQNPAATQPQTYQNTAVQNSQPTYQSNPSPAISQQQGYQSQSQVQQNYQNPVTNQQQTYQNPASSASTSYQNPGSAQQQQYGQSVQSANYQQAAGSIQQQSGSYQQENPAPQSYATAPSYSNGRSTPSVFGGYPASSGGYQNQGASSQSAGYQSPPQPTNYQQSGSESTGYGGFPGQYERQPLIPAPVSSEYGRGPSTGLSLGNYPAIFGGSSSSSTSYQSGQRPSSAYGHQPAPPPVTGAVTKPKDFEVLPSPSLPAHLGIPPSVPTSLKKRRFEELRRFSIRRRSPPALDVALVDDPVEEESTTPRVVRPRSSLIRTRKWL